MKTCCFCKKELGEWGNNPWPYFASNKDAECCDECNFEKVIVARLIGMSPLEADLRTHFHKEAE